MSLVRPTYLRTLDGQYEFLLGQPEPLMGQYTVTLIELREDTIPGGTSKITYWQISLSDGQAPIAMPFGACIVRA
jgi:hypothetical protein